MPTDPSGSIRSPLNHPAGDPTGSRGFSINAPAKLHLNLLVGPRESDGFHPLDSFVAQITLYDELTLQNRPDGEIVFHCENPEAGPNQANLVHQAAETRENRQDDRREPGQGSVLHFQAHREGNPGRAAALPWR